MHLGCEVIFDPVRGGYRVAAKDDGSTNIDNVYAVGEIAGIGGSEVAMAEGRAAAGSIIAARRGTTVDGKLSKAARSQRRASDAMLRAFPVLPGLFDLVEDDTIVCRCEDVTQGAVRQAAQLYGKTARGIKLGCRAGMGPCQARICGPNLQACVDQNAVMDRPVVQVPLKPVRTTTLL